MSDPAAKTLDWDDADETSTDEDWLDAEKPAEAPDACALDDPACDACQ